MKQLLKISSKLSVWILVIFLAGCTDNNFEDLPQVESSFTYTINEDSGTVTFFNVSKEATTYLWNFGDGTTSKEKDPIKTYTSSGTYKVTLVASNQAGASNTYEDEISLVIKQVASLPITFDEANVIYEVETFGGTSFQIVENPDVSGSNDKEGNVGEITNGGNEFEGVFIDLGSPVDLTEEKTITMNFWSEVPIDVLLKLEEGTAAAIETVATHAGEGWEEISFTYDSSESYSRLTLFADGPGTTAGTFYFDDIDQVEGDGGGDECVAETSQSLDAADFNLTFQTDPGDAIGSFGGNYTYIANPDFDNMVNTSCQVGQIDRNGEQFANTQIEFDAKFDFNTNSGFKMKVWSPVAGTNVLVKLEDKTNSGINAEVAAVTTTANAWEELTFDFAPGESGKHDKIILFFELNSGVVETYYIDDFMLYGDGGGGPVVCAPETSQSLDAADFDLTFQTDPGAAIGSFGGDYTYIANPDFDNTVNTSCQVGQIDRNGEQFANTQIEFDAKFDFNTNSGFKLKVWSPVAGTNVLVKLEDKTNPGINVEVAAVTTTANAWEELTFDFAPGESGKHDKIILFFELNSSVVETYYIDDFRLYGDGGGGPVVCVPETSQSLDASDFDLTFQTDPGAAIGSFGGDYTYIENPDFDNVVNQSCQVGQIARNGEQFANTQIEFDAKFDFNTNSGFKLKVWSPVAGTNVLVKLEDKTNPGINVEVAAVTTTANAWEELTFNFAAGESGKHDRIILFFELNSGVVETYYIDDFRLYGDGGGGGPLATFPLDFEDGVLFFNAFEGATAAVIDNPKPIGNSSAKVLELGKPAGVLFSQE